MSKLLLDSAPAASSVVAFVTTVHIAFVLLRGQSGRSRSWLLALPSVVLAGGTWVESSPPWLLGGMAGDVLWFAACHVLARRESVDGALKDAEVAHRFVPLRVLGARSESSTIRTLRLSRPRDFEFEAGQFLTVKIGVGERQHVRCYSISSSPHEREYIEISVRRQGLVSGLLHATVRPGGRLLARRPGGHFVYPADVRQPIVLLGGGIGITPLIAMLRHAVAADRSRPIALIYSARHPGDIAFREELTRLERKHPALRVVLTITGESSAPGMRQGRIDAQVVRETVSDPSAAVYMLCGPLPMIAGARKMLADLGVPDGQIRFEAFEAAAAAGARVPGAAQGVAHRLTLAKSGLEATIDPGESLLDAAERAGADIPSVCRSGVCGTCRTKLVCGKARCTSETLAPIERENGFVLPCVTWADEDCVLEA